MKTSEELQQWLKDNEKDFEPESFSQAHHFYHKVLKHAMEKCPDIDIYPVFYWPYERNMNKDKANLIFRIEMIQGAGEGAREPYEAIIEFNDN